MKLSVPCLLLAFFAMLAAAAPIAMTGPAPAPTLAEDPSFAHLIEPIIIPKSASAVADPSPGHVDYKKKSIWTREAKRIPIVKGGPSWKRETKKGTQLGKPVTTRAEPKRKGRTAYQYRDSWMTWKRAAGNIYYRSAPAE